VWARQKGLLSECLSKFDDKGCGPPDLPPGFDIQRAQKAVRRAAPKVSGPLDFIRRGGLVPIGIGVGTGVFICTVCPTCCLAGIGIIPSAPQPITGIVVLPGGGFVDDPDDFDLDDPDLMNQN
jgi:hypothetical protein